MSASIRPVAVTVNLQGKTVELQQLGEDALFGRASYGKYAYAVGCERLFGLLDRHGIKSTVFVPGAEAEANPATAHMFIINPLSGGGLAGLFASHPSTEERIARLNAMAADMGQAPKPGPWG